MDSYMNHLFIFLNLVWLIAIRKVWEKYSEQVGLTMFLKKLGVRHCIDL